MSAQRITTLGTFIWAIGTLFYTFEMLIKSSVSAMSGIFIDGFAFTGVQLSWIGSTFYIVYVCMQVPAGLLSDRLGIRISLSLATALCAAGTLLFAYADSFALFVFSRAVMGAGGSFAFVSAMKLASMWFPGRIFPIAAGMTQLLGYLGGALAGTPLSILVTSESWDHVFAIMSIIGFGIFASCLFFVRAANIAGPAGVNKPTFIQTVKQLILLATNRQVLLNGVFCATTVGVAFAMADLWGKQYLMSVRGISESAAALAVTSLIFIGIATSSPIWGAIATAINRNKGLLVTGGVLGIVSTILMLYTPIPVWSLYIVGYFIGAAQASHVLNFDVVKKQIHADYIGTAVAFLNMFAIGGAALAQLIIGFIMDGIKTGDQYTPDNFKTALCVIPIMFIIATIAAIFLKDKPEKDIHFEHHE
jgi:MFS family permease